MRSVIENFLKPMQSQFIIPSALEQEPFAADLADALGSYSDYQLTEAARWLKQNRTQRSFPTIADCRLACERFAASPGPQRAKRPSPDMERSDAIRQEQREKDGAALCRTWPVARQAHREGWLTTLLEFAEDNLREPTLAELRMLKAKAERTDENLHREPRPIMYASLCNLRAAMKARAAARIWGAEERKPQGEIIRGRTGPSEGLWSA